MLASISELLLLLLIDDDDDDEFIGTLQISRVKGFVVHTGLHARLAGQQSPYTNL